MNPVPCPSLTGSGSTGFSPLLGHIEEIVVVSDTTNAADRMLAALRSPDEETRIRALHRVCPCAGGFSVYERYMDEVRRLKKDPSPRSAGWPCTLSGTPARSRRSRPSSTAPRISAFVSATATTPATGFSTAGERPADHPRDGADEPRRLTAGLSGCSITASCPPPPQPPPRAQPTPQTRAGRPRSPGRQRRGGARRRRTCRRRRTAAARGSGARATPAASPRTAGRPPAPGGVVRVIQDLLAGDVHRLAGVRWHANLSTTRAISGGDLARTSRGGRRARRHVQTRHRPPSYVG